MHRSGELRVQVADLRQHVQQYTQQLLEQQSLLGQARAVYQVRARNWRGIWRLEYPLYPVMPELLEGFNSAGGV